MGAPRSGRLENETGEDLPPGAFEVAAPRPLEISGVAALPEGYAVVGDEESRYGRIWPGGEKFRIGGDLKGPESIDVGFCPDGAPLWLILGEKRHKLVDLEGGSHTFGGRFREKDGRGLEGLAVQWVDGGWRVAVAWEGGFYDWKSDREGKHAAPEIAVFTWVRGKGIEGAVKTVRVSVPKPSKGQRFRIPDLVWDGSGFIVLLASTDKKRTKKKHTWLQRFDRNGQPVGEPFKLEEEWGRYREHKNWEALDWSIDGRCLVMAYDTDDDRARHALVVFPKPAALAC